MTQLPATPRVLSLIRTSANLPKVYGPHLAILYGSTAAQTQMRSLGHFFNPHGTLENKMGLAGASYELVHAIPAILDYIEPAGGPSKWAGIVAQESQLQETLLDYLNSRDDVTIWGEKSADPRLRVPTISFSVEGWSSRKLVETTEKDTNHGFRWGTFYSVRLVTETLGLDDEGVVRVSMVHYNTGRSNPATTMRCPVANPWFSRRGEAVHCGSRQSALTKELGTHFWLQIEPFSFWGRCM